VMPRVCVCCDIYKIREREREWEKVRVMRERDKNGWLCYSVSIRPEKKKWKMRKKK